MARKMKRNPEQGRARKTEEGECREAKRDEGGEGEK